MLLSSPAPSIRPCYCGQEYIYIYIQPGESTVVLPPSCRTPTYYAAGVSATYQTHCDFFLNLLSTCFDSIRSALFRRCQEINLRSDFVPLLRVFTVYRSFGLISSSLLRLERALRCERPQGCIYSPPPSSQSVQFSRGSDRPYGEALAERRNSDPDTSSPRPPFPLPADAASSLEISYSAIFSPQSSLASYPPGVASSDKGGPFEQPPPTVSSIEEYLEGEEEVSPPNE